MSLVSGFQYAKRPSFDNSGFRLRATILLSNSTREHIVFAPPGVKQTQALDYLALGDSFSSGEGESEASFYKRSAIHASNTCNVSSRAYPYLLASYWNVSSMQSVACSGAETNDVFGSTEYFGQGDRARELIKNSSDREATEAASLKEFQAGIVRQLDFVTAYAPNFVSIGIGGNDAGLIGKLKVCLGTDTCEWADDESKRFATAEEIKTLYYKLRSMIKAVRLASPKSQIMAVGYPRVINERVDARCGTLLNHLLNAKERQFMDESIKYLNSVVKAAAMSEGAVFGDIEDAFVGHRLCDAKDDAMNGIRRGDDIAPIGALPLLKIIGSESFHPTPHGHSLSAQAIVNSHASIPGWAECDNCATETEAPSPPSYWQKEGSPSDEAHRQMITTFTESKVFKPGDKVAILTEKSMFESSAMVNIELRSEQMLLGETIANDEGQAEFAAIIPINISEGYHTLHLYGRSAAGDLVDVYQVIAVQTFEGESEVLAKQSVGSQGFSQYQAVISSMNFGRSPLKGAENSGVLGVGLKPNGSINTIHPPIHRERNKVNLFILWLGIGLGVVLAGTVLGIWKILGSYRKRDKPR